MSKTAVCEHPSFESLNLVHRILSEAVPPEPIRFHVDIHVRCAVCGVRFEFIGPPMGFYPDRPTVSADRFELRAPIEPNAHVTSLMAGGETGWPGRQKTDPSTPVPAADARIQSVEFELGNALIESRAANKVAKAAQRFCSELQEDAKGVPRPELEALHAALHQWEEGQ
jgi:hypothetical protein